jgi:hypothetical protein
MGPWPSNQGYVFLGSATQNQGDASNYGLLFGTSNDVGSTFLNGSTQIVFRIRNADQMRLTSDGNFGIGTHTPRAKLEVVGVARVGDLAMGPWPANSGNYVFLGSALMDQAQSGNYGLLIGTNAEQGNTHLNAASVVSIRIRNQQRLVLDSNTLTVTARLVALDQEDWKTPNFLPGWKNYGGEYSSAGYMKDSLGFVRLRGLVKDGAGVIFKLPVGYTPSFRYLHCISNSGESGGRIDVTVDGNVIHVNGSNGWVSLDGITFRAETPPAEVSAVIDRLIDPTIGVPVRPVRPVR